MEINFKEMEEKAGRPFKDLDDLKDFILESEGQDDLTSADIGGLSEGYETPDFTIPNLTIGIFPLLEIVDSPFVKGIDGEIKRMDFVKALYIIFKGVEAVKPLMGIAQRRDRLKKMEEVSKTSPEFFSIYLDKLDQLNAVYGNFEEDALAFVEGLGLGNWLDVEETVIQMFEDLYESMSEIFSGTEAPEKKTPSTMNG